MSNSERNRTNNNRRGRRQTPKELRAKGLTSSSASNTKVIRFAPDPFMDLDSEDEGEETFREMYGDNVESDFIITLT